MASLSDLAAWFRSYPSKAAGYLLGRLTSIESSISGLAADVSGMTCLSGDAVGDWMYLSSASTVTKADADGSGTYPALGVIVSKETTTSCTVRVCGLVTGLSGLTAGAVYYLDTTAGGITATPPTAPAGAPVALAVSTTSLVVLPLGAISAAFRSVAANLGANLIGYQDSGSKTTAATVDAALDEIYLHIVNGGGVIELRPQDFYLATGAPLAIFANGASAVPGMSLTDSEALGIRWNDNATHNAVVTSFRVPPDLDIASNASVRVICSKTGATLADAATFDIAAFNQVLAALHDADADYGGTSAAITGDAAAKTIQSAALTLLAANLAAHPAGVTMTLKPTDGTLATADDLLVLGVYILYTKKATS